MSKNSCEVTSRLVLTLFIGIFLGSSLSSLFFYPQKISNILQTTKPSFRFREKLITRLSDGYSESLADKLYRNVRVLCWVLTMPENHKTKAIHVKNTWGKRCNKLLFMSTATDFEIDSIALPVEDGRNSLWDKTRLAFHHVYNYHFKDYDYFLKADDDSYYIMENVRYMLSQYNPNTALYFGHRYASKYATSTYMAGGGYILSKKALEKFAGKLMHNGSICRIDNYGAEDLELGKCLENHTIFTDERDELLQKRFFPVGIVEHFNELNPNNSYWYTESLYYDSKYGNIDCCSDTAVNFHYISPMEMYKLDYLIYNVHPFGLEKNLTESIPRKFSLNEIIKASDIRSNSTNFTPNNLTFHVIDDTEKYRRR